MRISQKGDLISFDWAIRTVLRDKANCDIVEGFLSALLRQEIKTEGRVNGMAEAMLANHQPLEKIKLYTGLSEAEILQLKSG